MNISSLMTLLFQVTLTGGSGGVFLVNYATKDLFLREEGPKPSGASFPSEYDELMWLAERQRGVPSEEETLRFYELRDRWPQMHSDGPDDLNASSRPRPDLPPITTT